MTPTPVIQTSVNIPCQVSTHLNEMISFHKGMSLVDSNHSILRPLSLFIHLFFSAKQKIADEKGIKRCEQELEKIDEQMKVIVWS